VLVVPTRGGDGDKAAAAARREGPIPAARGDAGLRLRADGRLTIGELPAATPFAAAVPASPLADDGNFAAPDVPPAVEVAARRTDDAKAAAVAGRSALASTLVAAAARLGGSFDPAPFEREDGRVGDQEGPDVKAAPGDTMDLLPPPVCSSRAATCCECGCSRRLGEHARRASAANSAARKVVEQCEVAARGVPQTLPLLAMLATSARSDCSALRCAASVTFGGPGDCSASRHVD